ncbi:MAG TPA: hypothetical protein V6C95_18140 [Coleofasciculaceae cyanobacterium]
MKPPYFLKNLPATRIIFRPMLLVALGLHGIVLMLPISSDLDKPEPEKEKTVKITKLPITVKSSSQSSPQSSSKPTPQPTPQKRQTTLAQTPPLRQINPSPIIIERVVQIKASPEEPISQPSATPDEPQKKSQNQQENKSGTPQEPTQQDLRQESNQSQKIVEFFAVFPRYPGAKKGSGGVLRSQFDEATYIFHTDDNLERVASKFEKELLPNENFARPKEIRNDTNFKVYEVSSDTGEKKFLHLISKQGKTAIYLESDNYSLEQLTDAETEDRDYDLFTGYIFTAIEMVKSQYNLKNFDPEKDIDTLMAREQFTSEKFDLKKARKTTPDKPVSQNDLVSSLNQQLNTLGFASLSPEGNYERAALYKVANEKYVSYIVLAPTKDNQIVIILSKDDPRR